MAEGIFKQRAKARGHRCVTISMGTLNLRNRSAASNAVAACEEIGVNIAFHSSQGLSAGLMERASHIFVMEEHHRQVILAGSPGLESRVLLMGSYDGGPADVEDPVGQDLDAFRACRDRIIVCIDAFLDEYDASRPSGS